MSGFINYNGKIFDNGNNVINITDHSYRYGDGLFETMKVKNGNILYEEFHFDRLLTGLEILKFTYPALFTPKKLAGEIVRLCEKNDCALLARIRLSVSRGSGGLYDCDNKISYLIECWPLEEKGFNENGLTIDIFPDGRKSIDAFSNLKSANYLSYVMAAVWARENNLDDALILNSNNRICDATIANIFWVKNDRIFTPPLNEGCVSGVMRKKILRIDQSVTESVLTEDILLDADEVFLTNVITGLRWVKQFRNKKYQNSIAGKLFRTIQQRISS